MSSTAEKAQIFYTNMQLLGFNERVGQSHRSTKISFSRDMFKVPNKAGFEEVAHFLFTRLNPARAREEFRDSWPVIDKKKEQSFRRVCHNWLSQIAQDEADAHLPKIVPSMFQSPGGDRFSSLMFLFSSYTLMKVMQNEHGVKSDEMLYKPFLTPQTLDLAPAMSHGIKCMLIDNRKKFFDRVQTRTTLHETWQKSARDMMGEHRELTQAVREREADIQSLLGKHSEKGFRSPVRLDKSRRTSTPASKHGRVFDVNVESVRRDEKVEKVRSLWKAVEEFLDSTSSHQQVVSSILSGVVHEYVLNASQLDLRVPEILLRECERELLKRGIGNTYKAGNLDLVSILNLFNLSLHLYLERVEEEEAIDLRQQLSHLEPQIDGQESQLRSCQQLAGSLRNQLIPELKESIRALKGRWQDRHGRENVPSKLGMKLQPNSPPLAFDPNLASQAELERTKMTFTPDMLPQESTPDAVARIMKSINQSMKPHRLAFSDVTNREASSVPNQSLAAPQSPAAHQSPAAPRGSALSPLTQGQLIRARKDISSRQTGVDSLNSSTLSPLRQSSVEVSRVGSRQRTRVIKGQRASDDLFSPEVLPTEPRDEDRLSESVSATRTPTSRHTRKPPQSRATSDLRSGPALSDRDAAFGRLYSEIEETLTRPSAESPSDALAARIAQSIMEDGDGESPTQADRYATLGADANNPYNVSNVLDELGGTGFMSRDKIARTPETSTTHPSHLPGFPVGSQAKSDQFSGKVIYATPCRAPKDAVVSADEDILDVETVECWRSSFSEESEEGDLFFELADNVTSSRSTAVRPRPSSPREDSLSRSVLWTPGSVETGRAAAPGKAPVSGSPGRLPARGSGRRIVESVLDEEPLFIDTPLSHSFNENNADLIALMPPSGEGLHESSGFIPSLAQTGSAAAVPRIANPSTSGDQYAAKVDVVPVQFTMEEVVRRFEELKKANLRSSVAERDGARDDTSFP